MKTKIIQNVKDHLARLIFMICSSVSAIHAHAETIQEAIEFAVNNTPITVVAINKSIAISKTDNEFTAVVTAQLIQGIKGNVPDNFDYVTTGQIGDEPNVSNVTFLLSLCIDQDKYYHPGLGAEFEATQATIAYAIGIAEKSAANTDFHFCD